MAEPFPYTMTHLTRVRAPLKKPEVIGETPEGLHVDFWLDEGTFEGEKLSGTILGKGADFMVIRPDGVGMVNVHATFQLTGGLLYVHYHGVFDWGVDGYANFLKGEFPTDAPLRTSPRFIVPSGLPDLEWLNRVQCVGVGTVVPSEDGKQYIVEYDVYAVQ